MRKSRLTYDQQQDVRGIGVVIAPNRHPSRSAWRAQRTRVSTRSHLRTVSTQRQATTQRRTQAPVPNVPRVTHDTFEGYTFALYRDTATLALQLIMDNVPTEQAKRIADEHRHYLDMRGVPATIVNVSLGAGRGW